MPAVKIYKFPEKKPTNFVQMSKILVQLILAGTQIFGRAFADAYRQAAANAGKSAGATAAATGSVKSAVDALTRKTGISFEESAKILNVERGIAAEELQKNYQHLFDINSKEQGGSFYLQSKVVRAKERIDMELEMERLEEKLEKEPLKPDGKAEDSATRK
jgi:import inner membrane translocase subunit TIM16